MHKEIDRNISVYFKRFNNETSLSHDEVVQRSSKYLGVIEKHSPRYAEQMKGIASGSDRDILEIAALNVRYELMYSQFSKIGAKPRPRIDGCTAFAAMPEAVENGHLLMAQNWDWVPEVEGLLVKARSETGPDVLSFTEAGVVGGKIGVNSEGVGLLINGLVSNEDDWARLETPFHVRCWEILESRTLDEAVLAIAKDNRSCSANFILGQQTTNGKEAGLVNIESSPIAINKINPNDHGVLAHTNHFCNPNSVRVHQVIDDEWRSTLTRYDRIWHLLDERTRVGLKLTISAAKEMLRDHEGRPDSVCRHPNPNFPEDERYKSVVSIVMDLSDRSLWATRGVPCEIEYSLYKL